MAVTDALDGVLLAPLVATEDLPPFDRSAMDGYAVRAADTIGASAGHPARLTLAGEVAMGQASTLVLAPGACALIHTGGMLPPGSDAIVMVEHTRMASQQSVEIRQVAAVGEHIVRAGEDVRRGEVILPAGHPLRPQDLGALLAQGITQVTVARPPRVGILSQGDEVTPPDQAPGPGQVRDINSYTLAALVRRAGGVPVYLGIAPDQLDLLQTMARRGWETCDALVISAGSSVSYRDMTAQAIAALGQPGILVHGVAVRPGKPTILAVCEGKPVFGLPGNPVSAMTIFDLFVTRTIREMLGAPPLERRTQQARLAAAVPSLAGREDYVRVQLEARPDGLWATPIFGKTMLIYTLVCSAGVTCVPAECPGLAAGAWVTVNLY
jgi:molybdopterin molybdotransferase